MAFYFFQYYQHLRFKVLFLTLFLLLVTQPIAFEFSVGTFWFDLFYIGLLIATVLSFCQQRHHRWLILTLGVPPILLVICGHFQIGTIQESLLFLGDFSGSLFLFFTAGLIIRNIDLYEVQTLDNLLAVISGYLLLGLAWGLLYSGIEFLWPGSFAVSEILLERSDSTQTTKTLLVYYSFVTLTTVGFGDITPISATARSCSWVEAITGQFYLAIIVAGLVGAIVTHSVEERKRDPKRQRNR